MTSKILLHRQCLQRLGQLCDVSAPPAHGLPAKAAGRSRRAGDRGRGTMQETGLGIQSISNPRLLASGRD